MPFPTTLPPVHPPTHRGHLLFPDVPKASSNRKGLSTWREGMEPHQLALPLPCLPSQTFRLINQLQGTISNDNRENIVVYLEEKKKDPSFLPWEERALLLSIYIRRLAQGKPKRKRARQGRGRQRLISMWYQMWRSKQSHWDRDGSLTSQ